MQQLPEQMQKLVDEFKKNMDALAPEDRAEKIKQLTEAISSMNQDVKGMLGVLQTAKDKKDIEELKSKMQGNNS